VQSVARPSLMLLLRGRTFSRASTSQATDRRPQFKPDLELGAVPRPFTGAIARRYAQTAL